MAQDAPEDNCTYLFPHDSPFGRALPVFDAFAVVLRESAELILILGSLAASLRAAQSWHLFAWVAGGAAAGCALGTGLGLWLIAASPDPRWTAGLTFVLAAGVLVLVSTLLVAQDTIRSRTQAFVAAWLEKPSAPVALLAFSLVAGLRETLEAALFLRSLWLRTDGADVLAGAALGLAGVACLAVASRRIGTRIGLLAVFRLSAVLLSLLAVQMMLGAVAEFGQAVAAADGTLPPWWSLAEPVLPEGRWYAWICTALVSLPVLYMLRTWWRESSR